MTNPSEFMQPLTNPEYENNMESSNVEPTTPTESSSNPSLEQLAIDTESKTKS